MVTEYISIGEFARRLGVSRSAVQYGIKKGRVTLKDVDGKRLIAAAAGRKQWAAHTDKIASDKAKKKKKKIVVTNIPYEAPPKFDKEGAMTIAEADRRDKVNRAKLSDLKYKEQAKELVHVDKVQREGFLLARKTRDAVMQVPSRFAHELAVITDPHKIEIKLTKLLQKALQKLITTEEKRVEKIEKEKEKSKPKVGANDKG